MKLYNTLTRSVQEFSPMDGQAVRMYVCGPTVYDDPHIGHARSAYTFDVLRRYLLFKGYAVTFVRNVTDVDDKIIEKARQGTGDRGQGETLAARCREVAARYLKSYHDALELLGIGRPTHEPAATAHIDDMLNLIAQLVVNGSAYETKTGDVYFAVRKFPGYGKLSNRAIDELQSSVRGEPPAQGDAGGGAGKQDPLDFALWKAAKPGEPSWASPWGQGRPGWHIECSAMSTKYLGNEFDIHGGGVDLVFPHHENEVAQAQAAGRPFARYWVHNGLLTVDGEKMSKSLGNYTTVETALKSCKGEADVLKMFFLSAHYRTPVDYSSGSLHAAHSRYQRMVNFFHRVMNMEVMTGPVDLPMETSMLHQEEFASAMDDDLNTPKALAVLDGLVTVGYQMSDHLERHAVMNTIFQLGKKVFGLFEGFMSIRLSDEQRQLLHKREEARKHRDFVTADQIRITFSSQGLAIEDTPEGPVVLPKAHA